jgi:hypothetical protein
VVKINICRPGFNLERTAHKVGFLHLNGTDYKEIPKILFTILYFEGLNAVHVG